MITVTRDCDRQQFNRDRDQKHHERDENGIFCSQFY